MQVKQKISPCVGCNRIPDPELCDNKKCGVWQCWFVASWDRLRLQLAQSAGKEKA